MGYYKQLEIARQADVDRTIAWYKASGQHLPAYLHAWLLNNDERLEGAIKAWETHPVAPKPATEHVALQPPQVTRKQLRYLERNKPVVSLTKLDYNVALGVLLSVCALIFVGLIYALVVV